jgi:hypothetical protein
MSDNADTKIPVACHHYWDGKPGDSEDDFWQSVADLAYMLDNEPPAYQRQCIDYFLQHFPEPELRVDVAAGIPSRLEIEGYRRFAVYRLLTALNLETQ